MKPAAASHSLLMVVTSIVGACLAGACGASAPPRPRGSAASLSEPEAQRVVVVRSLREDPPLPGESVAGWEGLEGAPDQQKHVHDHHQHHHHQPQPPQPQQAPDQHPQHQHEEPKP